MQHITIVEHSEEGLQQILTAAEIFSRERVLDGILCRKYDVYDIEQMKTDVLEYHAKMNREINSLKKFSKEFNRQFATDNNKCFKTAEKIFRKIRCTVSAAKKIYKSFCQCIHDKYKESGGSKKVSVFTHSVIARRTYNRDLFGEESFPQVVREYSDELESFFYDLVEIIVICMNVTKEEQQIKDDPKRLYKLYNDDGDTIKREERQTLEMMKKDKYVPSVDPMSKYKKAHSFQAFLRDAFHNYDRSTFRTHKILEEIEEGNNDGLDDEESILWKDHHDMVPKVRLIIQHFDELEPKGRFDKKEGKYKLDSKVLARFVKWCMLEGSNLEATFIDGYFKKHYQGEYLMINANSVNTAKNNFTKQGGDPGYADFNDSVEGLLKKYEKNDAKIIPLAANY